MTTSRGIPSSRAYWELKADQMMNRIFDPDGPIDLDDPQPEAAASSARTLSAAAALEPPQAAGAARAQPLPAPTPAAQPPAAQPPSGQATAPAARPRPLAAVPFPGAASGAAAAAGPIRTVRSLGRERPAMLVSALGGIGLASLITSLLYLNHANQVQQSLRQERNLLLVERLRSLGPASPVAAGSAAIPGPATAGEELPPPPDEPWAQQLSQLPRGESGGAAPLRVSPPLPAVVNAPSSGADRDSPAPSGSGPVPQLVGVVGAPGKPGSAIFQVGGSSSSVSAGETIGGSGWRLRSADGDTALIERGGEVRRVAISGGF